jgi:hypothetical protein
VVNEIWKNQILKSFFNRHRRRACLLALAIGGYLTGYGLTSAATSPRIQKLIGQPLSEILSLPTRRQF